MTMLAVISFAFSVFALLFLSRALRSVRRGRVLRACSSGVSGAISAALASAAIIIAMSYFSYGRLVAEQDIGEIEFTSTGPDAYQARLKIPGKVDQIFDLRGDEWQLDARMISWQPPLTVLGLEPIYKLERLSGRYASVDRELREARTVHDLSPDQPLDLWRMARRFPVFMPGVDAYYGSATYLPMANGARFAITLSRDALLARPSNEAGLRAVARWGDGRL
ncbi:MAG: hypothetical protein WBN23_10520 [Woeseia sp.]